MTVSVSVSVYQVKHMYVKRILICVNFDDSQNNGKRRLACYSGIDVNYKAFYGLQTIKRALSEIWGSN